MIVPATSDRVGSDPRRRLLNVHTETFPEALRPPPDLSYRDQDGTARPDLY
jgi:hypothetical protein